MINVLTCNGADAREFLQNQLTGDLRAIGEGEQLFTSYCNIQGRVICTLIVCCGVAKTIDNYEETFYLAISDDLLEDVKNRLQKYIFRAKVKLSDFSQTSTINVDKIINKSSQTSWDEWLHLEINNFHAWINKNNSEKFTPQMLGLDQNGGVSFTKGCYPGQEIVARTHYLGKAKRGLFQALSIAPIESINDEKNIKVVGNNNEEVGAVINYCQCKNHQNIDSFLTLYLISINVEQAKNPLSIIIKNAKIELNTIIATPLNKNN